MNLIPFAILTLCLHQALGQENVKSGDFVKSPRRLSNDKTINYNNNVDQKVPSVELPDSFVIKKPVKTDKSYDDFLSFLYRNDKAKKFKREIKTSLNDNDLTRGKRALVFRPLFVYKQQEIKRMKVMQQKNKTKKPVNPTKPPQKG